MNAVRIEATVEADGELHLTQLPCRRGDKVEAIVRVLPPSSPPGIDRADEHSRDTALDQFLTLARSSTFCSAGRYPARDELHERH